MSRIRPWDTPPPGLELDGFMETHETSLSRMRARVGTYRPAGRPAPPLAGIAGKDDDPVTMMLDAWATVADVLSFYQRRLLAEGFVGTAVDDRSVHEIVRAVAVDVQPALSAGVDLSFMVADKQPGAVTVPRGTSVQSVPGGGGGYMRAPSRTDLATPLTVPLTALPGDADATPQIFETVADLSARAEWNEMALARAPDAAGGAVRGDAVGVLVKGGSYGVGVGDALLFATRTPLPALGLGLGLGLGTVRTVQRLGRARPRGCTLFLWSPEAQLAPGLGAAAIDGLEVFTCRAPEPLYGSDAPAWAELTPAQRAQYRAMVGGLQSFDDGGGSWSNVEQAAPPGYPEDGRIPVGRVLCLAVAPGGALLVGVEGKGLLRRTDRSSGWAPTSGIVSRSDVLCLTVDGARVYAGTSRGVFRSSDQGQTWEPLTGGGVSAASTPAPQIALYRLPATAVRGLAVLAGDGGAAVIAGTDDGVFSWDYVGAVWPALNQGLPASSATTATARASLAVRAVVVDLAGKLLYAGTDRGLFVRPTDNLVTQTFRPCDDTSASFAISALAVDADGTVFAGLGDRGGLGIRGTDGAWTRAGGALADVTVRALAVAAYTLDAAVVVATDHGVFRSRDGGRTFERLGTNLSNPDVTALALSPDGAVLAATPLVEAAPVDGKAEDWPAWPLQAGSIELGNTTQRVAPGDRVALVQDGDAGTEPRSLVLLVRGVTTTARDGFRQRRQVTTVLVDPAVALSGFDRRRARVRFGGSQIPLFGAQIREIAALASTDVTLDDHLASDADFARLIHGDAVVEPAPASELELGSVVSDLTGRRVVVVGKSLRVRTGAAVALAPDDARVPSVSLVAGEVLELREERAAESAAGLPTWKVRTSQGVEGLLAATPDLTLLPAADDSPDVAQVRTVTACVVTTLSGGSPSQAPVPVTRITLDAPLAGMLDAATVTVGANVVTATHGRTATPQEVLGIADGTANLKLTLRNKPLTWTMAGGLRTPALAVWVAKHRWTWVASFVDQGPGSRAFLIQTTSDGASVVCFGDGVRGSRPPAEAEIIADYRYGAGAAGNVDAGRITMIRQRPLGLKAVVNPLPATGGTDAEVSDDLRTRAPLQVRALDRIVSVRDCEDVVAVFPGIARAAAGRVWNGRRDVVLVTVATDDEAAGYQLDEGSAVYRALARKLRAVDAVEIASCVVSYVDVAVTLTVDPDVDAAGLQAEAIAELIAGFGFEQRQLRQDLAASDVVATLAALDGVRDVRVERLATADGRVAEGGVLAARGAHLDPRTGAVVATELLLVNADPGGITLAIEAAT